MLLTSLHHRSTTKRLGTNPIAETNKYDYMPVRNTNEYKTLKKIIGFALLMSVPLIIVLNMYITL